MLVESVRKLDHVLKVIEAAKRRTMMHMTSFAATLTLLKQALEALFAKTDANQTRILHSRLLTEAKPKQVQDVERVKCAIKDSQLQLPEYATSEETTNLQTVDDVVDELINMPLMQLVDWTATWAKIAEHHSSATHVLEFGPDLGVAKLSDKFAEGLGIEAVMATAKHPVMSTSTKYTPHIGLQQFIDATPTLTPAEVMWAKKFGPHVTASGGLYNRFTHALNKPPIVVAGMKPTTSLECIDLVAGIQNAGFHGELAAGGLSRPNIFEDAVNELVSKIKLGLGITINMLYLNAKHGVLIESITIGAGIPTQERALEMMSQMDAVGIKVVCFKTGSVDGIHAVLKIAAAMPSMTVMLPWTGGRAGGHHSFEDFHQPMEETYAAIRRVSNVLLLQYLTGEWSLSRGHLHKKPADGILMGSRVMVAKEAATAPAVKKLLVDTPGIESELEWETSYTGVVGGVVTVTSELGEPIHVVANRCALLWKEFNDKYFSIPREQVELVLRLNKQDIIARLNADYQKPYFGCKRNVETGEVVPTELEEMSYGDVLTRLVDLTYVEVEGKPQRWFITRTEERFRHESAGALFDQSELKSNPRETLSAFIAKYPATVSTLMSVPDCDFFLELCRMGGKPANFVPVIDTESKTRFKMGLSVCDEQRVFILQDPVAVRYGTEVDEPEVDIQGGINTGFINVVKESDAIAAAPVAAAKPIVDIAGAEVTKSEGSVEIAALAASVRDKDWLEALIVSTHVVEKKMWLVIPITKKEASNVVVVNEMAFQYYPELPCSIHAEGSGFIDKMFYPYFWVTIEGKEEESCEAACTERVMSPFTADFSITKEEIVAYCTALGLSKDEEGAPANFVTIVPWRPQIRSVFTKEVKANLLGLLHLASATFLPDDDIVTHDAHDSTCTVALISRKTVGEQLEEVLLPLVELHSEFLIRGSFNDFEPMFLIDKPTDDFVTKRQKDVEILKAKSWLKLAAEASVRVCDHLSFELTTKKHYASINSLSFVEASVVLCREEAGSKMETGMVQYGMMKQAPMAFGCPGGIHLRTTFGLFILEMVRKKQKSITAHFW
ncbi:hypothetical protein PHYSODRAFT_341458 [Phytophthora sojae]|uniref:Fatty acid synthase beta subunit AflB /Fas1-like central domain-containing protein n=1 Tax=Phytophthora sojae (strain P6497) TaxID=1094619 RepID=G5ADB1_PHYSP|nr:hypothetical protein PHYSODRAFT_341458 [Phytophthora sojae]EGZ06164.1 hypothetical protein PHYSODRAFT_341458 [Phytophthora sojae]|eukprot:XP_009538061.1 hypothetical protein PHYSODRAFT_341458 [Phytophthora sojae]